MKYLNGKHPRIAFDSVCNLLFAGSGSKWVEKGANYLEKVVSCFSWRFFREGVSDEGGPSIVRGAELRTVRDVSHWVNDPVQVQGNRGMGVSIRPHTVSQHHISLAPRPVRTEPDKTPPGFSFFSSSSSYLLRFFF